MCLGVSIRSTRLYYMFPIPVAVRSKASVRGRLIAGIAGLNPAGGMTFLLLSLLCVLCSQRPLRRADHSFRRVLPVCVRLMM